MRSSCPSSTVPIIVRWVLRLTDFDDEVYALCSRVPAGKITTYKEISLALGIKGYQAVGQSLRRNPFAPVVPCHRVVSASGKIGGFQGCVRGGSIDKKISLLRQEGVAVVNGKVNLQKYLHVF